MANINTSVNRLEGFDKNVLRDKDLYVVGKATEVLVEQSFGLACQGGGTGSAQALAEYIIKQNKSRQGFQGGVLCSINLKSLPKPNLKGLPKSWRQNHLFLAYVPCFAHHTSSSRPFCLFFSTFSPFFPPFSFFSYFFCSIIPFMYSLFLLFLPPLVKSFLNGLEILSQKKIFK